MKKITTTIFWMAVAGLTFFAGRGCGGGGGGDPGSGGYAETRIDTLTIRDTVRDTILVPIERRIVRVDTVWLRPASDSAQTATTSDSAQTAIAKTAFQLPIEQKIYATLDYRAVVEGFRPALVEMELYPKTVYVTRETTRTKAPERWGIGLQAGYGFSTNGAVPYIGIGVQYRILAW